MNCQDLESLSVVVAAALFDRHGRVLVQRRPPGKPMAELWEFPGGKVEPGETAEVALVRELNEELGIVALVTDLAPLTFVTDAPRPLVLLLFRCLGWTGEPVARHATALRWSTPGELSGLPMPPLDLPLVAFLQRDR